MNDDKLNLDPETMEDRGLLDSLSAVRGNSELLGRGEACSLHPERDSLIWAYADGFLIDEEEEAAWEEISQCRFCLDRLAVVQRALGEAEVWLIEPVQPDHSPTAVSDRILALFNFEWVGEAIHTVGAALTIAPLQPVLVLGPEDEKPWRGQLEYTWRELHMILEVEIRLEAATRPRSLAVWIKIQDQAAQPVSQMLVDFGDIQGTVMETGTTDIQGRISFSSDQGERFVLESEAQVRIGFCLELTQHDQKARWSILISGDVLDIEKGDFPFDLADSS
jgi:hypothetical protein